MDRIGIIKNSRPFKRLDITVCILITAAFLAPLLFFMPKDKGNYAEVYCGSTFVKTMYLNTDGAYRYSYQGHYNIITVKGGKISVTESDCPDKICSIYAPSDIAGASIICVPHNLLIIIKGEGGVDGVACCGKGGAL